VIARAVGVEPEPDERLAPGASAADLREAIAGRGATIVAVGHQPDCSEIVLMLAGRVQAFAPGSLAEVEL
jgi:phosphohistidine phosphatase SixA